MYRRIVLAGLVVLASAASSWATNVNLTMTVDLATSTWRVFAQVDDLNNKGIASFQIDVIGFAGITATRFSPAADTNASSNPPFSSSRTSGSAAGGPTGIGASQDVFSAINNHNNSGLVFGLGVQSKLLLAQGFYSGLDPLVAGGLSARATPGSSYYIFPSNFSAQGEAGTTTALLAAQAVVPIVLVGIPEPNGFALTAIGGFILLAAVRRGWPANHQAHRTRVCDPAV